MNEETSAEKLVREIREGAYEGGSNMYEWRCDMSATDAVALVTAAIDKARAEAFEEAAKVCEAMTKDIVCPEECAEAIRALAAGKGEK